MKRIGKVLLVSALISSIIVTPVFATPSIDDLKQNKTEAEQQANALQKELTGLLVKIDDLEVKLIAKGQEVIKATDDLKAAKIKEVEQYDAMKLRIKYMYEEGNASFLEKLFASESISDVLNQAEYMQSVHSYDRNMLKQYENTKKEIETLKTTLEVELKNIETMQVQYESEKETLNTTLVAKQAEVANFDKELQAAVEAAAAAAAARQREAEAAANQGNNKDKTNTNNGNPSGGNTGNQGTGGGAPVNPGGGGAAVVSAAYQYLGVPYVWGGESSSGVDCSGLVLLAHRAIGVRLSHSSAVQGGGGQAVNGMANALPGDVVCYSGHVGIYVGDGKMIHAPQPGQNVTVISVYGSPWFRRYW